MSNIVTCNNIGQALIGWLKNDPTGKKHQAFCKELNCVPDGTDVYNAIMEMTPEQLEAICKKLACKVDIDFDKGIWDWLKGLTDDEKQQVADMFPTKPPQIINQGGGLEAVATKNPITGDGTPNNPISLTKDPRSDNAVEITDNGIYVPRPSTQPSDSGNQGSGNVNAAITSKEVSAVYRLNQAVVAHSQSIDVAIPTDKSFEIYCEALKFESSDPTHAGQTAIELSIIDFWLGGFLIGSVGVSKEADAYADRLGGTNGVPIVPTDESEGGIFNENFKTAPHGSSVFYEQVSRLFLAGQDPGPVTISIRGRSVGYAGSGVSVTGTFRIIIKTF